MKLDDRFMTILTVLVLIVGVGALMNRGEDGASLFGGSGTYRAQPDVFTLRAGRVQSLDVLLNDLNVERVNADQLAIKSEPNCGSAIVVAGTIQYSDSHACEGRVEMQYCVPFEDACDLTVVTINVLKVENIPAAVASNGKGEPLIMTDVAQGSSPTGFANETFAMSAPVRLEVPDTAEVTTPAAAVAEIRNRNVNNVAVATDVASLGQSNANVSVDNSTARVSRVGGGDVALQAPAVEGEASSGINIASASRPNVSAPRAAAPQGFGGSAPSIATASALPSSNPSLPTAPSSQIISRDDDGTPILEPSAQPEPRIAAAPKPEAPAIEQPKIAFVTPPQPATNPQTGIDNSDLIVAATNPASLGSPTSQQTPDHSGVLANLANSNSFLGVTVSAAKGLLSPEAGDSGVRADTTTAAPRPKNFEIATGIGADAPAIIESARNIPLPQIENPITPDSQEPARIVASLDTNETDDVVFKRISRPASRPVPQGQIIIEAPVNSGIQIIEENTSEVAALVIEEQPRTTTPPLSSTACGVDMSLQARSGAELVATVVSPCRPGQAFQVNHAGLEFSAETDIDGVANFIVPAMQSNATVEVQFSDGARKDETIQVRNMDKVTRVAVMWSADIDFDLHAREFGAQSGTLGHIWSGRTGDYSAARRAGGGYLTLLGPQSGIGAKAEVYTIIQSSRTQSGLVDLSLELAGFGQQCDTQPEIRTLRSEGAKVARDRDIQFTLNDCAVGQKAVIRNAIQDIRISRR